MEPRDYFKIEADELIGKLTAGLREAGSAAPDRAESLWRELGRAAHTLKGAAHVVREKEIAQVTHDLEDLLAARDIPAAERLVDRIAAMIEGGTPAPIEASTSPSRAADTAPAEPPSPHRVSTVEAPQNVHQFTARRHDDHRNSVETVRVDVRTTDELLKVLAESAVLLNCIRAGVEAVQKEGDDLAEALRHLRRGAPQRAEEALEDASMRNRRIGIELNDCWARLRRQVIEAERVAHTFRLAPAAETLLRIDRVARRTAEELGFSIDCTLSGTEERIDLHLLAAAEEALSHIARNAVVHGLSRKTGPRKLQLGVRREDSMLIFFASDNGIGIDPERVRQQATENGWMEAEEARHATSQQLLDVLARPGVSTRGGATTLAGRGIGLDVARTRIRQLGGDIAIQSVPGEGTTISLRVPETLLAFPCLVLETSGTEFAIPLSAVMQTHKLSGHRTGMAQIAAPKPASLEGLTLLDAGPLLAMQYRGESGTVVEVRTPSDKAGIMVDRVVHVDDLVIQPAPVEWQLADWIMGTYSDDSGYARLVLDPMRLNPRSIEQSLHADSEVFHLPPVLVIDDSLTSRTLEASILTSAGYEVDTAVSAENGLEKARKRHYGLYFVDVEMPGMNGFDFVRITREDPVLGDTPVVMVTSRNLPGDRDRGLALGASDYIIKGDFDQGKLLETAAALLRRKQKVSR